ncbi:MAG: PKD domain-containing protein [Actinobacteria bacterium]|nr:PKD domain-containing protein [Actinomycetota bacterium]
MIERRRLALALLTALATAGCLAPPAGAAAPRPALATTVNGDSVATFDALTGVFGAPLALGGHLWGVAIAPDGASAYVADESADSVIPVDVATGTLGTPIPVGSSPRILGITPDGATAYVANIGSGTVTPIDTATNTAGAPIAVGSGPHGIAIAPDGSRVYVANLGGSVSVIDTATNTVLATIATGGSPYTIAITPDGATVFATDLGNADVFRIDTATDTASTIAIPVPAFGVAVAPDGRTAYVSASSMQALLPIDTATGTVGTPISIGSSPEGIGITPDGSTAWVTDVATDTITPLDLASGTAGTPTPVGHSPMTVAITPDRSPTAAFTASPDGLTATLDASASSDPDGSVARYAWDFGDGQTATTAQPTVRHVYAQGGSHSVTLTVTDDERCSDALVFTGQTAACTGSPGARVVHAVTVTAPSQSSHSTPHGGPPARQVIERFTLARRCVRPGRDGTARVGLRLRLALPGAVDVEVDRALTAVSAERCPKRNPDRRYAGKLRRVATLDGLPTQAAAASVRRTLTRGFALRPGLYRVVVRAHGPGGALTRPAYRWVRVLARA